MRLIKRSWFRALAVLFVAALSSGIASAQSGDAQNFPSRPLHFIYPFTPGSATDAIHRLMTAEWSKQLGQPVLFENRPGAGGRLALLDVVKQKGDGHYLAAINSSIGAILPLVEPDNFNMMPGRDYTPVAFTFYSPWIMLANPAVQFRDVRGLIAYAKANPGKLNWALDGIGTAQHLGAELFKAQAGIDFLEVPYKENIFNGLMSGDAQLLYTTGGQAKSLIDSGKAIAIATTGPKRWDLFPNVPTVDEGGLKGFDFSVWIGVAAPAQVPPAVVAKLNAVMNAAVKAPAVAQRFKDTGSIDNPMSPEQFTSYIKADLDRWAPIVKKVGVKPN